MSLSPEPQLGHYTDSCGSIYEASRHKTTGWHLCKWRYPNGHPANGIPFPAPDFPHSVRQGHFTLVEPI